MSGKVVVNPSSIKLVKDELVKLVTEAGADFEATGQQAGSDQAMACASKLQQTAGIYRLLELADAAMLADELRSLLAEPQAADPAANPLFAELTERAFAVLGRYPEYLAGRRRAVPALLLEDINALRSLRKQPALAESLFAAGEIADNTGSVAETQRLEGDETLALVRRLRHMYQVGLLAILKTGTGAIHLRLMQRAAQRMAGLAAAGPGAEYWIMLNAVISGFMSADLLASPSRKRLLASADRQFRACLQSAGELAATPPAIRQELLFVAAAAGDGEGARALRERYGLEGIALADAQLAKERELLLGPSGDTLQSMVSAVKADLKSGKRLLEEASLQGESIPPAEALAHLQQVAAGLKDAGVDRPAQVLEAQLSRLDGWIQAGQVVGADQLSAVADAILFVESSLADLRGSRLAGGGSSDAGAGGRPAVNLGVLGEAQALVLEEAMKSLDGIKRAINVFVESSYDVQSLADSPATMREVSGCLVILDQADASGVMDVAAGALDRMLVDGVGADGASAAESLADILVCIEYFLAALGQGETPDASILAMAQESVEALLSPLSAAS